MQPRLLQLLIFAACSAITHPVFAQIHWQRSANALGRGSLLPANVAQSHGNIILTARATDYSGAEIVSDKAYGPGTFTVKGRCSVPTGALCAFFLYEPGTA